MQAKRIRDMMRTAYVKPVELEAFYFFLQLYEHGTAVNIEYDGACGRSSIARGSGGGRNSTDFDE